MAFDSPGSLYALLRSKAWESPLRKLKLNETETQLFFFYHKVLLAFVDKPVL